MGGEAFSTSVDMGASFGRFVTSKSLPDGMRIGMESMLEEVLGESAKLVLVLLFAEEVSCNVLVLRVIGCL